MSDQQTKNQSANESDQAKSYDVSFVEWDVYCITLDATSEDDAIEKATERWNEVGADDIDFHFKKGGNDEWESTQCTDDHLDE